MVLIAVIVCAALVIGWASLSLYHDTEPTRIANQQAKAQSTDETNPNDESTPLGGGASSSGVGSGGGGSSGAGSTSDTPETPTPQGERIYCTSESHDVQECDINDHPVCGWYDTAQITCSSGPCVRSTFPNECEACMSQSILYWTEGECPIHE